MNHPRRKFLKSAAQLGSGLVLTSVSAKLIGCGPANNDAGTAGTASTTAGTATNTRPFGLQLYTLRDDLPKDPKGILKQVASFGYKHIEGYEGPQGLFWGMSNTDFKKYLDDLGLQFISSHCNTRENFEQKAAQAAQIGMKYLINPYLGAQKTLDDYKRAADEFNKNGEICRKAGLKFAYHNHGYSFTALDGQFPQDVMMQNTDPNLVDYEMDIYWVVAPGQDPEAWLKKYPGRFKLGHVKDRQKGATEDDASVVIGTGTIDFAKVLKTAAAAGMEYFFVEQERYDGTTPLKATQDDAEAMKRLQF
jgi:sugar phosphate isomerase/epimerase